MDKRMLDFLTSLGHASICLASHQNLETNYDSKYFNFDTNINTYVYACVRACVHVCLCLFLLGGIFFGFVPLGNFIGSENFAIGFVFKIVPSSHCSNRNNPSGCSSTLAQSTRKWVLESFVSCHGLVRMYCLI